MLERLGARFLTSETQVDTYFQVPAGRLKIREIDGTEARLIAYRRPDQADVRASDYHLVEVAEPARLRAALGAVLPVRGQVCKRRDVFLWHNVRIHLDEVHGLGPFLELEAVVTEADDEAVSRRRLDELCSVLEIRPGHQLAPGYADLLGL